MKNNDYWPSGRTGIHIPLLLAAVCGIGVVIGLVVAVVWGVIRLVAWLQS